MAISFASTFIAGRYVCSFGHEENYIGATEDGYELETVRFGEELVGDNGADTVQDVVYRGGNCFLSFVCVEWSIGTLKALTMFSESTTEKAYDIQGGYVGDVGNQWRQMAGEGGPTELILTADTSTTAEDKPAVLTASVAMLAHGFSTRINFSNRHRKIPLRFQLLPYIPDGLNKACWYEVTPNDA